MPEKKSNAGRKCTICTHQNNQAINRQLAEPGSSFRHIASQFGAGYRSVARHAVDCLNLDVSTAKREILENNQEFYNKCLNDLFERANKMQKALDEWLTDPFNPNSYTISPRGDEMEVVYLDYLDKNQQGEPKRKKASLAELIMRAEQPKNEGIKISALSVINQAVDNRKLMLEAQKNVVQLLAQFAKTAGLEQMPKENESELANIKKMIQQRAEQKGTKYFEELQNYLNNHALPQFKEPLTNELKTLAYDVYDEMIRKGLPVNGSIEWVKERYGIDIESRANN